MFFDVASRIAQLLTESEATVSVAESSTGGLISANLLAIPGASSYFVGGSVVYTLHSRRAFLSLDRDKLRSLKPLTEAMVQEFAHAARLSLDTTWGIAELGATGPAGTPYGHGTVKIETHSVDRQQNMLTFTEAALDLFAATLERGS